MILDCPHCEADVDVDNWPTDGDEITCPKCGVLCEVEEEYYSDGGDNCGFHVALVPKRT